MIAFNAVAALKITGMFDFHGAIRHRLATIVCCQINVAHGIVQCDDLHDFTIVIGGARDVATLMTFRIAHMRFQFVVVDENSIAKTAEWAGVRANDGPIWLAVPFDQWHGHRRCGRLREHRKGGGHDIWLYRSSFAGDIDNLLLDIDWFLLDEHRIGRHWDRAQCHRSVLIHSSIASSANISHDDRSGHQFVLIRHYLVDKVAKDSQQLRTIATNYGRIGIVAQECGRKTFLQHRNCHDLIHIHRVVLVRVVLKFTA